MGKLTGKNAFVNLDNSAGTLVDLSNYGDNAEISFDADLQDVTGFGDGGHKRVPGLKDESFNLEGAYDGAAAAIGAHLAGIYSHDDTQTFEIGPEGSTSGMERFTGECRLANYNVSMPVDGRVEWSAEFQVDGVTTRDTF